MWNFFKYNNKNNRVTSLMLFWCFCCWLWRKLTPFSSIFIADFEQVNDCWISWKNQTILSTITFIQDTILFTNESSQIGKPIHTYPRIPNSTSCSDKNDDVNWVFISILWKKKNDTTSKCQFFNIYHDWRFSFCLLEVIKSFSH